MIIKNLIKNLQNSIYLIGKKQLFDRPRLKCQKQQGNGCCHPEWPYQQKGSLKYILTCNPKQT